jgi:hypothetical protein
MNERYRRFDEVRSIVLEGAVVAQILGSAIPDT